MRPPLGVIRLLAIAIFGGREALFVDFELDVVFRIDVVDHPTDLWRTSEYSTLAAGTNREDESPCGWHDPIKNEITPLARVPNVIRLPRFVPVLGLHGVGNRSRDDHRSLYGREREPHSM